MPALLAIRTERSAFELRLIARRERDGRVSARLLALANALEGLPREEAARLAGMTGQTLSTLRHDGFSSRDVALHVISATKTYSITAASATIN